MPSILACILFILWVSLTVSAFSERQAFSSNVSTSHLFGSVSRRNRAHQSKLRQLEVKGNRPLEKDYVAELLETKYSPAEFKRKVANYSQIVFFGNSVTRYQYLAFVYALGHNEFVNISMSPNLLNEHTFSDWMAFFRQTNAMLEPHEYCDCARAKYIPGHYYDGGMQFENRYYYDNEANLSVSFIWSNGDLDYNCHGHWADAGDYDIYREPRESGLLAFWSLTFPDCFKWTVKEIAPPAWKADRSKQTALIMNVGHHGHHFDNYEYAQTVAKAAASTYDKFIWKTTTVNNLEIEKRYPHDTTMCGFDDVICLNLNWTWRLDHRTYMWDNLHYHAPVYNKMNEQLYELL